MDVSPRYDVLLPLSFHGEAGTSWYCMERSTMQYMPSMHTCIVGMHTHSIEPVATVARMHVSVQVIWVVSVGVLQTCLPHPLTTQIT